MFHGVKVPFAGSGNCEKNTTKSTTLSKTQLVLFEICSAEWSAYPFGVAVLAGHADGGGGGGRVEVEPPPQPLLLAGGGHGLAQREQHGARQQERRLAHGLQRDQGIVTTEFRARLLETGIAQWARNSGHVSISRVVE